MLRLPPFLTLVLILLLGLALRLTGLFWGQGYFYFGQGDAVTAYSVAVDLQNGQPAARYLAQPSYNSYSKLPGPLWTLFCLAGLRLAGTITGVMLLTILLNTAVIWLTYRLALRTLGPAPALWAAVLAATSPSAVFYSVGVYNPEVMPFLGACLGLALWNVLAKERSPHIFWVAFLLLMMPQFHMSGLALWPAVAVALVLGRVRLNAGWLLAGLAAGLLLYVPYLLGDSANGWQNTRGVFRGGKGFTWEALKSLTTPFSLLVNWVPQWTRSRAEYIEVGRACFGSFALFLACNILSAIVAGILAVSAFIAVRHAWKERGHSGPQQHPLGRQIEVGATRTETHGPVDRNVRAPGPIFLALMSLGPLVVALLSGRPFHTRYALVLLPALLALAGGGAATAINRAKTGRWVKTAILLTACVNAYFLPAFYHHQKQRIEQGPQFLPSFHQLEAVYRRLESFASNRPIEVDDAAYLRSLAAKDPRKDTGLIRRYVQIRQREKAPQPAGLSELAPADSGHPSPLPSSNRTTNNAPVVYRLMSSDQLPPTLTGVAYCAYGIALVTAQ